MKASQLSGHFHVSSCIEQMDAYKTQEGIPRSEPLCQLWFMMKSISCLYPVILLGLNIVISNNLCISRERMRIATYIHSNVSPADSYKPSKLLAGAAATPSLPPLLLLWEIAPSCHCNRKANNAPMLLSLPHFLSRAASPSTPPPNPFFCPPHLSHIFLPYDPPIITFLFHSHAVFFFQAQSR